MMYPQLPKTFLLWFVVSCILNTVHGAQCNADNCLRALFPSSNLAPGRSFCATFLTTTNTATTGFPSSLGAPCGTNPSRYSSACSCSPTSTTVSTTTTQCTSASTKTITAVSTTTTTITSTASSTNPYFPTNTACIDEDEYINNGGFECALSPWAPAGFYGVAFEVTSPGHSGSYSYSVSQILAPNNSDCCPYLGSASLDQNIRLPPDAPGKTFTLTFWTYFYSGSGGFVGAEVSSQPLYTVDAFDHPQDEWYQNTVTWVQPSGTYYADVRFDYLIDQGTVVLIDDVVVTEG